MADGLRLVCAGEAAMHRAPRCHVVDVDGRRRASRRHQQPHRHLQAPLGAAGVRRRHHRLCPAVWAKSLWHQRAQACQLPRMRRAQPTNPRQSQRQDGRGPRSARGETRRRNGRGGRLRQRSRPGPMAGRGVGRSLCLQPDSHQRQWRRSRGSQRPGTHPHMPHLVPRACPQRGYRWQMCLHRLQHTAALRRQRHRAHLGPRAAP
mmetsp:Transcript_3551/g.10474  ORF Transcript_3551/g.10474 Transcript_3551/m.10474 type:complete len:205 (-) Transcript_3551:408-1022(-)